MKTNRVKRQDVEDTFPVRFKWKHSSPDFTQYKMFGFSFEPQEVYVTVKVPKRFVKSQEEVEQADGTDTLQTELTPEGIMWVSQYFGNLSKKAFLSMSGQRSD